MTIRNIVALGVMLGAPSIALVACGGGLAGLCNDICACQGCSDSELEECEAQAEKAEDKATSAGCEEQLDAFVECQEAGFKCDDDKAVFTDPCENEVKALIKCDDDLIIGVSSDPCARAAQICGAGDGDEGGTAECRGDVECFAKCLVRANKCDAETTVQCAEECVNTSDPGTQPPPDREPGP